MQSSNPFIFLLLLTGSFAAFYIPGLANDLLYDREAILKGEWWRLFTCHLVHFSFSHMLINLAVITFAYSIIWPRFRSLEYVLVCCIVLIGPALFLCDSNLAVFGGASGLAAAAFFFILLDGYRSSVSAKKQFYGMALFLCLGKVVYEFQFDVAQSHFLPKGVQAVPLSHLLGYLAALGVYVQQQVVPEHKRK